MLAANSVAALTVQEFKQICLTQEADCEEHPAINAYIGGGLDLLASLQEETEYLQRLYCGQPDTLFDAKKIIQFIEQSSKEFEQQNAMLRLVAYFEQQGGC